MRVRLPVPDSSPTPHSGVVLQGVPRDSITLPDRERGRFGLLQAVAPTFYVAVYHTFTIIYSPYSRLCPSFPLSTCVSQPVIYTHKLYYCTLSHTLSFLYILCSLCPLCHACTHGVHACVMYVMCVWMHVYMCMCTACPCSIHTCVRLYVFGASMFVLCCRAIPVDPRAVPDGNSSIHCWLTDWAQMSRCEWLYTHTRAVYVQEFQLEHTHLPVYPPLPQSLLTIFYLALSLLP